MTSAGEYGHPPEVGDRHGLGLEVPGPVDDARVGRPR